MQNTDFFAVNVTIVITIMTFVNFVNKYTQVQLILMTMINGSDVTLVVDGYFFNLYRTTLSVKKNVETRISMISKIKIPNIYV